MRCIRCGNEDPSYFYKGSKGWYCRKCVRFSRILLEEEPQGMDYEVAQGTGDYVFSYELTFKQKEASKRCCEALDRKDVLLHCVCGAGKTEICVESIASYLKKGLKVAYAIPRKEVVIELTERFRSIFPDARVVSVYGGHHEDLTGDLIVCTCHQLFRYYQTFDLLVLDEADAFPLKGDEALWNVAIASCKGRILFSTATIDEQLQRVMKERKVEKVELFVRPSGRPLSVPRMIYLHSLFIYLYLAYLMKLTANRCIIFVGSRKTCRILYRVYRLFFSCTYAYSDLKERKENIEDFRKGKYRFIFATSVLERGITIKGIDVILLDSDGCFDESMIIQMLGRVGRGMDDDGGKTYLFARRSDRNVKRAIAAIQEANAHL